MLKCVRTLTIIFVWILEIVLYFSSSSSFDCVEGREEKKIEEIKEYEEIIGWDVRVPNTIEMFIYWQME